MLEHGSAERVQNSKRLLIGTASCGTKVPPDLCRYSYVVA